MNVLFVTWDGPQTFYLESLFLPIFERLAKVGISFHVLQFTWGSAERAALIRSACQAAGVPYYRVSIWRRFGGLGPMLSALVGASHIKKAIRAGNIDVVMPRSTLPALASLLAVRDSNCPIVFDADGLPLDERVDFAGQSPSGLVYRLLRDIEAQAVRRAFTVVTRTSKAAEILLSRAGAGTDVTKFHTVTNGRDSAHFNLTNPQNRDEARKRLSISTTCSLIVYAGSIGPQYCIDEMLTFFSFVRKRDSAAHFLILTGSPELVHKVLIAHPQARASITTLSVAADQVAEYLAAADLGLGLRRPTFSMQAVAPIKLGEYLLCGLPVLATGGVGDTCALSDDIGYLVQRMDDEELDLAAAWFVNDVLPKRDETRDRARSVGLQEFSLEVSAATYERAFQRLNEHR